MAVTFNSVTLRGVQTEFVPDPDAQAYLAAVELADGQALELSVRIAVDRFVKGCKADGIWSAIKASCILAGARTLNGALVPLVGSAPTNNGFVSGDYNRKTGLVGNTTTKFLNSNRNNNADPQNDQHMSAYSSVAVGTSGGGRMIMSGGFDVNGGSGFRIGASHPWVTIQSRSRLASIATPNNTLGVGLIGVSRSSSGSYVGRAAGGETIGSIASQTPADANITVFGNGTNGTNQRFAFYSIGTSLNLALLDTRVRTLISDIVT